MTRHFKRVAALATLLAIPAGVALAQKGPRWGWRHAPRGYGYNRSLDNLYGLFPGANGLVDLSPAAYHTKAPRIGGARRCYYHGARRGFQGLLVMESLDHACTSDVDVNLGHFRLFTEGDRLYEAMLSAIGSARSSIRLETFIFAADEIGWRFAKALAAKAVAGVDVRFHFDAYGSATGASTDLYQYMENAGVRLKWYHPWRWWQPIRYLQRNHRKLLVIDEEEVFLGGSNIILENSCALYGAARTRDTDVKVTGDLARQAAALFDWTWDHPEKAHKQARAVRAPGLLGLYHNHMATLHALVIGRAARRVHVTGPYFCPGSRVERALRRSATRGVDVRLLVPRNSDPHYVGWMTRSAYCSLMKAGVRVYEYLPPRKLHAKSVVIDDEWAIVGSANLDHFGLVANHELVLVARDRRLGHELRDQFLQDLQRSEEVHPAVWTQRGLRERLLETLGWAARKLL